MPNPLYDHLFGKHAGQSTPFLIAADGSVLTHDAFLKRTAQFAHVLTALGLEPGDRLAAQVQKSAEALALYAACVQAG
ncbi:MAG: AMP-binding protein, partial [Pseudomonadota bacterium]